jgi:hypothetical protein
MLNCVVLCWIVLFYTEYCFYKLNCIALCWIVLFYALFVSIVLFYVLFVCKCVLYYMYCHRVSTQLQLNVYHKLRTCSEAKVWNEKAILLTLCNTSSFLTRSVRPVFLFLSSTTFHCNGNVKITHLREVMWILKRNRWTKIRYYARKGPVSDPYTELPKSIQWTSSHFYLRAILILYSNLRLNTDIKSPSSGFNTEMLKHFSSLQCVTQATRFLSSVFNLLKPTGHVMHHQFNIQQLHALPTLYLCVFYLSKNEQHKLIGFYNREEKCLLRGTDWVFK